MRAVLFLMILFGLGACTQVVTEQPVFGPAAVSSSGPRPGIWKEVCPSDETDDCRRLLAISKSRASDFSEDASVDRRDHRAGAHRLIESAPWIVELRRDRLGVVEYGWLDKVKRDGEGRIVEFTVRPVACQVGSPRDVLWNMQGTEDDITDNIDFASVDSGRCLARSAEDVVRAAQLNQQGFGDTEPVTFRFHREAANLEAIVGPWPERPSAPTPEPDISPAHEEPTAAQVEWSGAMAALAAAAVFVLAGLFIGGRWRWVIKPAIALPAAVAVIVTQAGWAHLPGLIWLPVLAVLGLLALDLILVRLSAQADRSAAPPE